MRKGISPLVASVLLIAITMAIAAILANWVSTYTRTTLAAVPTCIGGAVNYVSADYPKWDDANKKIIAAIESQNADLKDFKFEVLFVNDTVKTFLDTQGLSLKAGATGTVISEKIGASKSDIKNVRISTSCTNVKTDWSTLR